MHRFHVSDDEEIPAVFPLTIYKHRDEIAAEERASKGIDSWGLGGTPFYLSDDEDVPAHCPSPIKVFGNQGLRPATGIPQMLEEGVLVDVDNEVFRKVPVNCLQALFGSITTVTFKSVAYSNICSIHKSSIRP